MFKYFWQMRDDSPRVVLSWGDPSRRRVWQKCHSKQEEMSCVITLLQMRPGAGRVLQFQIRYSQYLEKAPIASFSFVKVMVLTVSHFKNL